MSEQMKQSSEFSSPLYIGEWRVYDIGATTISDLIKNKIINSHTSDSNILRKKPDALIVSPDKEVILYVESKNDGCLNSEEQIQDAIQQEFEVAKKIKAKIYIVRDSNKTIWLNPLTGQQICDEHGNPLRLQLHPATMPYETETLIKRILASISNTNNDILKEVFLNPKDLASQIHQKLWISKSVSPSTALYTFIELFLFKYLSDNGVLQTIYSFDYLYGLYEHSTELDVLNTYLSDTGARAQMKKLFPAGDDGTSIINGNVFHENDGDAKTFKSILKAFVDYEKINGKFINISKDFKSQLFESFLKQDSDSKNMGQFFTPLKIVNNMVRMVDIKSGMKICDPACGVGKFLLEAIGNRINEFYNYDTKNKTFNSNIKIIGFDKYSEDNGDKTIILAKANALIYFSSLLSKYSNSIFTKEFSKSFLNESFILKHSTLGTLESIENNSFDLILANPPYVQNGSGDIKKLTTDYSWGGLGIESMFMEWIVKSLKEGGTANVVIPDGILSNLNNKTLKEKIIENCYIESIISLPQKAFFNTPKKTYILTLKKKVRKNDGSLPIQTAPVFTYLCSSIGETLDVYRFNTPSNNDLKDAVDNYNLWKSSDKEIIYPILLDRTNGRFKAINISDFTPNNSWLIENWWTNDEKIKLNLIEDKEQSLTEFISDISNASDVVMEVKQELEKINADEIDIEFQAKNIPLSECFTYLSGNQGLSVRAIHNNKGENDDCIVLSSSLLNETALGYVSQDMVLPNGKKLKLFKDKEGIVISRNGYAGTMSYLKPGIYTLTDHAYILYLKPDCKYKIDLNWFISTYQNELRDKYQTTKSGNQTWSITECFKNFKFDIPSEHSQKLISDKFSKVNNLKNSLIEQLKNLGEKHIKI